uniref:ATPase n=2 Tax=Panagrellus redivivus TaxID=6233 RepID=A0A7E4V9T3_PANRE
MSTTTERARAQVEKIAEEVRKTGNAVAKDLKGQINMSHRSFNYEFGNTVNSLRISHLVALSLQAVTLFLESDRIGLFNFLIVFTVVALNVFLSGKRWYEQIDGRYDVQQLTSVQDWGLRAQYALALFGAVFLALLAHLVTPIIPAGMASFLYHLSDYGSIALGFTILGVELFEGIRSRVR